MEPGNNNEQNEKLTRGYTELFGKYLDIKTLLVLYLFIAVEWTTGLLKNKEIRHTTGIGLS